MKLCTCKGQPVFFDDIGNYFDEEAGVPILSKVKGIKCQKCNKSVWTVKALNLSFELYTKDALEKTWDKKISEEELCEEKIQNLK